MPGRPPAPGNQAPGKPLPPELTLALAELRAVLEPCGDVIFRPFTLGSDPPTAAAVVFCKSVVDYKSLGEQVLEGLMLQLTEAVAARPVQVNPSALAERVGLPWGETSTATTIGQVVDDILDGYAAVLIDGCAGALTVMLRSEVGRDVAEPITESTVRGPRDGFVETLETNITLLRRRLPVPEFRVERRKIGRRTRTTVAVVWLEGLVKPGLLDEVRRRLDQIQIDGVLESAYLEEMIEDAPLSPFPTIEHTERPDKVAASLLDGRVAIMTAHTPYALLVPLSFPMFLQAAEDYYERYFAGTAVRIIRYLAFLLALTLPAFYVAVTTYHHEMIPSALFISLAAQREGVPFPAAMEAFLMEVAFELLREAGVRLPRPVGQAVSIVGGLVIGEAAIRAKIASAGMVIVVATTGIASFALPAFNLALAVRLLRFPMMILGAVLGVHGVIIGMATVLIHMAGLRSFGVPYLSPAAPSIPGDRQDFVRRAPWWQMKLRPGLLRSPDRQRVPPGQMPPRGGK